jgi:hypothetical protein
MLVQGAYFRDDTIWRGRMLTVVCELRRAIFEFGFWVSGMFVSFAATRWWTEAPIIFGAIACVRFAASYYDQVKGEKRIERDIEHYFSERYQSDAGRIG